MQKLSFERADLPSLLRGSELRGIELGVATGDYSARLWQSGKFNELWGVDAYGDHQDTAEYLSALAHVGLDANYKLLRMYFHDALSLFPDEHFDFVYIDGYAHTGEEGGKTLYQWFSKVKPGGVIAGHDYHPDWPSVVLAVDRFSHDIGSELLLTKKTDSPGPQDLFPSWALAKNDQREVTYPDELGQTIHATEQERKKNRAGQLKPGAGIKAARRPWRKLKKHKIKAELGPTERPLLAEIAGNSTNKRVLIVGSAPSVSAVSMADVADCDVLFLNNAGLFAPDVNVKRKMLLVSDPLAVNEFGSDFPIGCFDEVISAAGLPAAEIESQYWFEYYSKPPVYEGFAQDKLSKPLYQCHTVAGFAVQIAIGMGYETVYLIGVDLDFDESDTHFYDASKREQIASRVLSDAKGSKMRAGIAYLADWATKKGVNVANLSPKESLPLVPRKSFEAVFPKQEIT